MHKSLRWGTVVATSLAFLWPAAPVSSHSVANPPMRLNWIHPHTVGPTGVVLTTSDGGQIFGWDIDRNGKDGILASSQTIGQNQYEVSLQTFDETTGKITKTLERAKTMGSDWVAEGIFAGDVGIVTHEVVPPHKIYATRYHYTMDPVAGKKITGKWTPPVDDVAIEQTGINQDTDTSLFFVIELQNGDAPDLIVSDVAKNKFAPVIHLDPNAFCLCNSPQITQDTVHNKAVFAYSPDGGAVGGPPPNIGTIDLKSGKVTTFQGATCPGIYGCGAPNGLAYDSKTGIAATTTEVDGGIEFYNVAKQTGIHEYLPGESQSFAGTYVANDPVNHLFFVVQQSSPNGGGAVLIYDENGNSVGSIGFSALYGYIALNPTTRTGWVNGPQVSQLEQFTY